MKVFLLALLALSAVFFAPTASAEECVGTPTHTVAQHDNSGRRIGTLYMYWNPDTGNNCAVMSHAGYMWGVGSQTSVTLMDCTNACYIVHGRDNWIYYRTNSVIAYGRGRCIRASGTLDYQRWAQVYAYSRGCY